MKRAIAFFAAVLACWTLSADSPAADVREYFPGDRYEIPFFFYNASGRELHVVPFASNSRTWYLVPGLDYPLTIAVGETLSARTSWTIPDTAAAGLVYDVSRFTGDTTVVETTSAILVLSYASLLASNVEPGSIEIDWRWDSPYAVEHDPMAVRQDSLGHEVRIPLEVHGRLLHLTDRAIVRGVRYRYSVVAHGFFREVRVAPVRLGWFGPNPAALQWAPGTLRTARGFRAGLLVAAPTDVRCELYDVTGRRIAAVALPQAVGRVDVELPVADQTRSVVFLRAKSMSGEAVTKVDLAAIR